MRLLIVVALASCTKGEPKKVEPDPVPAPVPSPTPVPKTTQSRKLLIESHLPANATASYLAVELPATPTTEPTYDVLGNRPALATPRPGYYGTLATQDGERWVYAAEGNKLVVGVMSSLAGGKPSYQIPVDVTPRGLHLAGDALYVGSPAALGWIDLAAPRPAYVELVKRDGYREKAYDLFTRDGDRLLAIDDEVMPMFADWFSLDGRGRPVKRLGDWKLPGVINGHYEHAALVATGANKWTLFLIAPYGIMSGNGHELAAVPIDNDKLIFDPSLTLQNADGKTPIVEEHTPRGTGTQTLLGGSSPTAWTGIAVAQPAKQVLVAAGRRGLMSLPVDFPATTRTAKFTELRGGVLDVREFAGKIYVLAEGNGPSAAAQPRTHLLILDPTTLAVLADHALPGPGTFTRFVR